MIFIFNPPRQLRRQFHAKGRFYRLDLNGYIIACRSTLEIFQNNIDIDDYFPDAYFTMLNPGESKSLEEIDGSIDGPLYSSDSITISEQIRNTPLTNAKPDRTQYQIMRLMNHYGWSYVRIINLSDIRNTTSGNLIEEHQRLQNPYLSVFSDCRDSERSTLLIDQESKPFVVAWGINPKLEEMAMSAVRKLPSHIKGLQGDEPYQYFHPLPRKGGEARRWLERFVREVKL